MSDANRAAELAARDSYGRLLAYLASRTHDIALAEDALADAFATALKTWPRDGVPERPDAWLLTVARNRLTDRQRHQVRFLTQSEIPEFPSPHQPDQPLPDNRLALMMVCAHPALASDLHAPLMLQTVLGIDARTIARLFLVSPAALTKRLVRAKTKIRDAGIPFQIPETQDLRTRANAIFEAIYALHAQDWLNPTDGMGDEALYLADLLCTLLPDDAEASGLAALIALSHARSGARMSNGILVPTEHQDTDSWDDRLIGYGKRQLARAYRLSQIGRFQIEAAIEAVHIARKDTGSTDWPALNRLYASLLKIAPSAGAMVAQAAVTSRLHGPKAGLDALTAIEKRIGTGLQPYWAARADMLIRLGRSDAARESFDRAISLTTDPPLLRYLKARRSEV